MSAIPVEIEGSIRVVGDCWVWSGTMTNYGYGRVRKADVPASWWPVSTREAHRLVFELDGSRVPAGHVLSHRCRTRGCVRHWSPVAIAERMRQMRAKLGPVLHGPRLKFCRRGHDAWTTRRDGSRVCRTCAALACAKHYRATHEHCTKAHRPRPVVAPAP